MLTLLQSLVHRIESAGALDDRAEAVAQRIRGIAGEGTGKDAISGTWLGHALHPILSDVPIGSWTSATLLDLLGGRDSRTGAERLIGVGIVAAIPTALSGASDWADTTLEDAEVRRVGAVHAIANVTALALYGGSLLARRRGRHRGGVALGGLGAAVLAAGGYLGGHLTLARGVGTDRTVFDVAPKQFTETIESDTLGEGDARCVDVGGVEVLLTRQAGRVSALANRCTHRGGPLHEGEIADGCVSCPWHGSRFRLDDGNVEQGPATFAQPAYEVREANGRIAVRGR